MSKITKVEEALRAQKDIWREIMERVTTSAVRDLPTDSPKRIILFGLGSSFHAAKLTAYSIQRDRTRARIPVIARSSLDIGVDVVPQRGDWVFAFSHRGNTAITMKALEACEMAGAYTILVCGKDAPEHRAARQVLYTSPQEQVEPHTMAVTGAVCAVTSLLLGPKAIEEWEALMSLGTPDLEVYQKRAGKGASVILGEWEGEWLAREGALKLMEMARLPVRAFSSEEFYHGPRFSVQEDESIWHVSMSKDPRNDEIKPSNRISVFGSSPLAWIPALVELQWLALGAATNLGVDPDTVGQNPS